MQGITTLDSYMEHFGPLLGRQAYKSLAPLHVPGRDPLPELDLLREPFEAQAHVIAATAKALRRQKSCMLVAEMGTGKTIMGMAAIHQHAAGKPYRALVFCPGQLARKWQREIEETIPGGVVVEQLEDWRDVVALEKGTTPLVPTWYIIARDRAKLGAKWRGAANSKPGDPFLRCPECGGRLLDDHEAALQLGAINRKRTTCKSILHPEHGVIAGCGAQLWQFTSELQRYEPAKFIHKKLKGFFKYLILDEVHEEKSATTAQANAAGALAAACKKVIPLTGTLIGGYAEHIRPLLFRLSPQSLVAEGLAWNESMKFSRLYGRIETTIRTSERDDGRDDGNDNSQSRGSKRSSKSEAVKPGIMPTLFGRHLVGNAVFLSLSEVADNLPPLMEQVIAVPMDDVLAQCYKDVEEPLVEAIKEMMRKSHGSDRRLLGTMLQVLLAYPDYPFGWGPVGYYEGGEGGGQGAFNTVCIPDNLDPKLLHPKEQSLIETVRKERAAGRQCWVYVQYTDKRDVQERLQGLLEKEGFQVGSLRASVSLAKREEWIAKNAPGLDVVISHPKLVETGLDLFDKRGRHNFSTLIFYETGYNLFTLRQAARRSWRIGQKLPCKVIYFYYAGTLQERAMSLMGKKLLAAESLEGKFSAEGLAAMAGDDGGSVEMALAKSLHDRLDAGDAQRAWAKVAAVEAAVDEQPLLLPARPARPRGKQSARDRLRGLDMGRLKSKLASLDFDALRKRLAGD